MIIGAGRVGTTLAQSLEDRGHSVAIIDQQADAFRRLSDDFSGRRVTGMGFDQDALRQAGIDEAYALAAVTSGDNSNILAARVAREVFDIDHVVARIYDPQRAAIYERLGITTVATVRWTADQVLRRMIPAHGPSLFRDAAGSVDLFQPDLHPDWIGISMRRIQQRTGARIAFLTRFGTGFIPAEDDVLQAGDLPHLIAPSGDLDRVQRALTVPPPEQED